MIGDAALVEPMLARGYVVIAPTGLTRPGRTGGSWSFGTRPPLRDELAFVREVLTDAEARFHIDRGRVLLTGFSVGGSLVWYLACAAPRDFAAFAPVAGGFWQPLPETCAGPVKLLHTHGWRDRTVPLEGRPLRPGLEQGDIFAGSPGLAQRQRLRRPARRHFRHRRKFLAPHLDRLRPGHRARAYPPSWRPRGARRLADLAWGSMVRIAVTQRSGAWAPS